MFDKIMQNFEKKESVNEELIKKFQETLAPDILKIWVNYGLGSIYNGFLKIINPMEYKEFVEETFFLGDKAIPIMTTGTGEIIAWVNNKYVYMLDYKENTFENLASGFDFFWEDLDNQDIPFLSGKAIEYEKVLKKNGKLNYEECFVMDKKIPATKMDIHEYLRNLVAIYGKI